MLQKWTIYKIIKIKAAKFNATLKINVVCYYGEYQKSFFFRCCMKSLWIFFLCLSNCFMNIVDGFMRFIKKSLHAFDEYYEVFMSSCICCMCILYGKIMYFTCLQIFSSMNMIFRYWIRLFCLKSYGVVENWWYWISKAKAKRQAKCFVLHFWYF